MTPVDELMVRLFQPPRILVVNDAPTAVELTLRGNYDCTVDIAKTGVKAVRLLIAHTYDLVLIDLALLNGTSEMVLAAIKRHCPDTPVVVTKVDKATTELVQRAGPLTLFTEPLTLNALERLFRVFKIKARTKEIAGYCQQVVSGPTAALGDA